MGDFGDGRLELDELGSVIDHASSLDAAPRDDLLEGNDAVTWSERLESSGVTTWLRRHRVALAATAAAVLVLGSAGTAYLRTRPPAQDRTIAVTVATWVSDSSNGSGVLSAEAGVLASAYRVVPVHAGDTVHILGIVGPGIRASTAHALSDTPAEDGSTIADVAAVIDCDAGDPTAATPGDFRLRVEQTDSYGRTTTGLADLTLSDAGQWSDSIIGPCFQQQLTEHVHATATRITADLAARVLTLETTAHNALSHDLTVSPASGSGTAVYIASELVVTPRGEDAVVPVRVRVTDCVRPRLDDAYVPDPGGSGTTAQRHGLSLFASVGDGNGDYGGALLVPFTTAQEAAVTSLLAKMCVGVPPTTVTVLGSGSSPPAVVSRLPANGDPTLVGLRTQIDVATTAGRVTVADGTAPEDLQNGMVPAVLTVSSDVRGGHARLTVDWAAACSSVTSPPTVALTLTSGSRSWPVRASLSDQHLLDAYRAACPELPLGDFAGMGWPSA